MTQLAALENAVQHVTTHNPIFEVTSALIRDVEYRVFKNIPRHVPALLDSSQETQVNSGSDYLVFENEKWSFEQFLHKVNRLSNSLKVKFGVSNGTHVAIAMRNLPEFLVAMMAISSAGGVAVLLNAWWTAEELEYALKDSGAKIIFADTKRVERLSQLKELHDLTLICVREGESIADFSFSKLVSEASEDQAPDVQIDADDDFIIMYSSGTTGHPKGIVQTHRGALNAVFTWLLLATITPMVTDKTSKETPAPRPSVLIITPLFHVTATHPLFLLSLPAGAKVAMMQKWDAGDAMQIIQREKISRFMGVPTQCADLLAASERLGIPLVTLDYMGSGGAKRPATQVQKLAVGFPNADIATGWGMTETNALGIGMAGDEYLERPGSAGRLQPPLQELRFLDESGKDVPNGQIGEITIKSPCNMRCYLNKPDATAEVLKDGWLRTGDLGFIDAEGYVTIVDRKKNIIIRGGENISCLDVEGALHRHEAITEACVFSVPHDRLGETVGAAVQVSSGTAVSKDDILSFLADHIAGFKIPEHIWISRTPLLRGATDKIDRRGIQKACIATFPDPTAAHEHKTEMKNRVCD